MDADSYLHHIDQDIKNLQDLSVEELTRDQTGKTDYYENVQNMLEQLDAIKYILDNIVSGKNDLDYGLGSNIHDMKTNTLKYIAEHLLERIHLMEILPINTSV